MSAAPGDKKKAHVGFAAPDTNDGDKHDAPALQLKRAGDEDYVLHLGFVVSRHNYGADVPLPATAAELAFGCECDDKTVAAKPPVFRVEAAEVAGKDFEVYVSPPLLKLAITPKLEHGAYGDAFPLHIACGACGCKRTARVLVEASVMASKQGTPSLRRGLHSLRSHAGAASDSGSSWAGFKDD